MRLGVSLALGCFVACGTSTNFGPSDSGVVDAADGAPFVTTDAADAPLSPDAACESIKQIADPKPLPVDIIWMIDNSASMAPAVDQVNQGMNAFANLIGTKSLDYRVIVLSLRGTTPTGGLYPICIPQPLAGDANCGNGANFYQSSMNIKSTQTFEQFLGTLGQTSGYAQGQSLGGEPWFQWLRPTATKTLVFVTDDNARLTAQEFQNYSYQCVTDAGTPSCPNPFNSNKITPGILDPYWNGLFDGFVAGGVYGWGDANDPSVRCTYSDNTQPPSGGSTYTDLITATNGPRAKICDGASAWGPFFDAVATAVLANSKIACTMDIPDNGSQLDPNEVNVTIDDGTTTTSLSRALGKGDCGGALSWYYDDPTAPTQVILCPAACQTAQSLVGASKKGSVNVLFGCATVVK
jgi:hypothetical protein